MPLPKAVLRDLNLRWFWLRWCVRRVILLPWQLVGIWRFRYRPIESVAHTFSDASHVYDYFNYRFRFRTAPIYWIHSLYFKTSYRGFGEPPFHALWISIFKEYRPQRCLEIGVYRGQVTSLWTLLHRDLKIKGNIVGITPFSQVGDSDSEYPDIDYRSDIEKNHRIWGISSPRLIGVLSNSREALQQIGSQKWDLVYIDGSHELEVVKSDLIAAIGALADRGLIVMDDSSLFQPRVSHSGAFAGHYGPSLVAEKHARKHLDHLIRVGHLNVFSKKSHRQ